MLARYGDFTDREAARFLLLTLSSASTWCRPEQADMTTTPSLPRALFLLPRSFAFWTSGGCPAETAYLDCHDG